jgi:hypothetical protein
MTTQAADATAIHTVDEWGIWQRDVGPDSFRATTTMKYRVVERLGEKSLRGRGSER